MARFYVLAMHADLMDGWSLVREWGRIGRRSQVRVEPFTELAETAAAGDPLAARKRRRATLDRARGDEPATSRGMNGTAWQGIARRVHQGRPR
jgi:predicted DNA-binding WGR domain protein